MDCHQDDEQQCQAVMDGAPLMTGERPQISDVFSASAALQGLAATAAAGWEDVFHDQAGQEHCYEVYKGGKSDNEI